MRLFRQNFSSILLVPTVAAAFSARNTTTANDIFSGDSNGPPVIVLFLIGIFFFIAGLFFITILGYVLVLICASLCFPNWYERHIEWGRRMRARNCYHCRQRACCCGNPTVFATTFPSASFPSGHNTFPTPTAQPKYMPSSVQVKY